MAETNLVTRKTIETLTTQLKTTFGRKTALEAAVTAANAAIKSLKVDGNAVNFYTSADKSGAAAFTVDFPTDMYLDQTKTVLVESFAWTEVAYPASANPNLDGKPVMVLAVKGDSSVTYSFLNMEKLMNVYKSKTEGKDSSTDVTFDGYTLEVKVNISAAEGNALQQKDDGLYVTISSDSNKADKDTDAIEGNLAQFGANGNPVDSGVAVSDLVKQSSVSDFTEAEITALLAEETPVE